MAPEAWAADPSCDRVLVTGAGGFIGGHLCRRLVSAGVGVHGVYHRRFHDVPGVRWRQADLTDETAAQDVVRTVRPDVIFHLASRVTGSCALDEVVPILRATLLSTVYLLVAARVQSCPRIVLPGSMEVPGPTEGGPLPTPYAAAKASVGTYARLFSDLYGLRVAHLRISQAYGPGQWDLRKLILSACLSLLKGEPPRVGIGRRRLDWIYIDDDVEALMAAAAVDDVDSEPIDIGSGTQMSIRDTVEQLSQIASRRTGELITPNYGAVDDRPLERDRLAQLDRAASTLDWRPTTRLGDGLERTVDRYARALSQGQFSA